MGLCFTIVRLFRKTKTVHISLLHSRQIDYNGRKQTKGNIMKKLFVLFSIILFLVACAEPMTKAQKGALIGAASGALLGQATGKDTHCVESPISALALND